MLELKRQLPSVPDTQLTDPHDKPLSDTQLLDQLNAIHPYSPPDVVYNEQLHEFNTIVTKLMKALKKTPSYGVNAHKLATTIKFDTLYDIFSTFSLLASSQRLRSKNTIYYDLILFLIESVDTYLHALQAHKDDIKLIHQLTLDFFKTYSSIVKDINKHA